MSGIAGLFGITTNEKTVESLLLSMKHRGPDLSSVHQWMDNVLLQTDHVRTWHDHDLPITIEWAGERYSIVFDGMIFNREEIRRDLMRQNHVLEGRSDAELMLRGYVSWREGILDRVNGVFALAIAHEKENKLFLARDRMGVKPLFYKQHGKGIVFASEMKTILTCPGVEAQLDAQGAGEILLLGPGRTPGSGVFKDVFELKPGKCALYKDGNLQLRSYWKLWDRAHTETFDETAEHVRFLVMDAVRCQLTVDNTAGTMLSGGLDSSLVSAICARELDAHGKQLETFSLDYLNNERYFTPNRFQPNMDTEYIRIVQDALDSFHHWTVLSPENLIDEICSATIARDLPGMADVDASLLAFCRQIKPYRGIVLSGECADEIFGGYPWYRDPEMRDFDGFPWARTTHERKEFLQGWIAETLDPEEFVYERYLQTIRQSDISPENTTSERRIKEMVNLNIQWFMQTLLDRGDRMGNLAGIEIRVPFCDYRIVEYLYGVPWEYKDHKGFEKGLLRKAMEGVIPHSVLYRKKSPFPKTYDPAYLEIVSQMLKAVLNDPHAPILQLVNKNALTNLLEQDFHWPWYGQLMRRPQTIVYMLQINYWLEHYSVRIV